MELPLVAHDRGPGLVDALADELEAALAGCVVREGDAAAPEREERVDA